MPRRVIPWTDAETALAMRRYIEGATEPEIAAELRRDPMSIKGKLQHLRDLGRLPTLRQLRASAHPDAFRLLHAPTGPAAVPPDPLPHPVTGAPWEEDADAFLARVLERTDREVQKAHGERFVRLRIESARPVLLSLSSDWHVSTTSATDVRGLIAYADAIAQAEGAYALAVGDLLDNPIKHKPTSVRDIPDDLRLLDVVVGRFGGKLLATTSGNHDDWSKALAGTDHLAALARQHRMHYAPDELVYVVEIVKPGTDLVTARYVVATRHKYRRGSTLNGTHAPRRWLEEMVNEWPHDPETGATYLPDVLAIGDDHIAEVDTESSPRGDIVFARMGAWQVTSSYARAKGFKRHRATAPCVILHPTRRQIAAHADYRLGLDHLAAIRARRKATG